MEKIHYSLGYELWKKFQRRNPFSWFNREMIREKDDFFETIDKENQGKISHRAIKTKNTKTRSNGKKL